MMKSFMSKQFKFHLLTESLLSLGLQNSGGTLQKSESVYEKPNILLLISEDNGPQLGYYGDPFARSPNLDYLGKPIAQEISTNAMTFIAENDQPFLKKNYADAL